jgi:hypothetical protein
MSDVLSSLALLISIGALCYAWRAYKVVSNTFHILESRSSRTVTVDHTDGRITVVKELKDAQ